jgi:hypothetical protein
MDMERLAEWELAGETEVLGKNYPSATSTTSNPTWHDLGSNSGPRRGKKPATSLLSYGMAFTWNETVPLLNYHLLVEVKFHTFSMWTFEGDIASHSSHYIIRNTAPDSCWMHRWLGAFSSSGERLLAVQSEASHFAGRPVASHRTAVFWDVRSCSLVAHYQYFGLICCLHHQCVTHSSTQKMHAAGFSQMFVTIYQTRRCHIAEDRCLNIGRPKDLRS